MVLRVSWLGLLVWCLLYLFFLFLLRFQGSSAEAGHGFPDFRSCLLSHTCTYLYHSQWIFACIYFCSFSVLTMVLLNLCSVGLPLSPSSKSQPAPLPPALTPPWTFRASFHQRLLSGHNRHPGKPSYHSSWPTAWAYTCVTPLSSSCVPTEPLPTPLWPLRLHLLPQLEPVTTTSALHLSMFIKFL